MKIAKFIFKLPVRLVLTIAYPIAYPLILAPLDQLGGKETGFLKGLKNLWTS